MIQSHLVKKYRLSYDCITICREVQLENEKFKGKESVWRGEKFGNSSKFVGKNLKNKRQSSIMHKAKHDTRSGRQHCKITMREGSGAVPSGNGML
jgi:hypothetical protein